jgi:hypothetical protein
VHPGLVKKQSTPPSVRGFIQVRLISTTLSSAQLQFELSTPSGEPILAYPEQTVRIGEAMLIDIPIEDKVKE